MKKQKLAQVVAIILVAMMVAPFILNVIMNMR
ncbi:Uncharacterised protein [Finegoldia magna]|uniref:Uncharacterized protein n=1 Tax=Finegoldia magna TaxID=1260 RepID=A0A6N3AZN9_FINMA